jgi:hypothetical protein
MAHGGYDNLTLFLLLVLTAIITHVLTIAMIPGIPMDNNIIHRYKHDQDPEFHRIFRTTQEPLALQRQEVKSNHNQTNSAAIGLSSFENLFPNERAFTNSSPTFSPALMKNEKIAFGPKPKEGVYEISKTITPVVNIWKKLSIIERSHSKIHQTFNTAKTEKPMSSIYKPKFTMDPLEESRWIGNDWFPPAGGRLYDIRGLKQVFGKYNILWVADPEFQLTYANLISLLRASDDGITSNKLERSSTQPCVSDTTLTACYEYLDIKLDYISTNCMLTMRDVISMRDLKKYHLLIIDFGMQEMHGQCPFVISEKQKIFVDVVQRLHQLHIPIVWTTMAWLSSEIISVNQKVRDTVAKTSGLISIFDYGGGMQLRHEVSVVYLKKKKKVFYSMPARMAYIQMLANHLEQNFGL